MRDMNQTDKDICKKAAEENWKIPASCSEKIEHILHNLPENEREKTRHVHFPKYRAAVLAAALIAVTGMTVAASELFKWDEKAVESFNNPTQEEQDEMTMSGIAKEQEISVTDAGITITAKQTVKDTNYLYILLQIQSDEKIIDGNSMFQMDSQSGEYVPALRVGDENIFDNISMGFSADTPSFAELSNEGYYEIHAMKAMDQEWTDDAITIQFNEYSYYTYENGETNPHKISGNWMLELPLGEHTNAKPELLKLDKEIDIRGIPVMIKRVELSPLSLKIVFDMDDWNELEEALYAGQEDVFIFETQFTGFLDREGDEIACGWGGMSGDYDFENREICIHMALSRFVDTEEVGAILLGDEKIPVPVR